MALTQGLTIEPHPDPTLTSLQTQTVDEAQLQGCCLFPFPSQTVPGLLRALGAVLWRLHNHTAGQLTGWLPEGAQVPAFQALPQATGCAFPRTAAMRGNDEVLSWFLLLLFMTPILPCLTQIKQHPVTHVKYLDENFNVLSKKTQMTAVQEIFYTQHGFKNGFECGGR